jgi:RNA polymerase sigma factor (sigma-70 family)
LLRNEHDVDDAFQATFAALACKAKTIRRQSSAAPWLYKVAYRAALAARSRSSRYLSLPVEAEPIAPADEALLWRDLRPVLDAEVQKLGEKYRSAFVLCYLQGLTHGEAAARLGCPEGTIHSRLATAKEHLRRGLERRGVTLSGTGMALEFATRQIGAPPAVHLIQHTLAAAFSIAGSPLGGTVTKSSVVSLTKGVLFTMWMQSYTAPALVTLVLSLVGVGILGFQGKAGTKAADEPGPGRVSSVGAQTDNNAQVPEVRDKPNEVAIQQDHEQKKHLQALYSHLEIAYVGMHNEQDRDQRKHDQERRALTEKLFENEEALRRLEQEITFDRDRERKTLGSLDEENSQLKNLLSALTQKFGTNHQEVKVAASQLDTNRDVIEKNIMVVKTKERQRSEELVKIRLSVDERKQQLKALDEKLQRTSSTRESQMAQLHDRLFAVREQISFPEAAKILSATPDESRASRLENKLDQVMRELTEVKKLLAKP